MTDVDNRPQVSQYQDPVSYMGDMLRYRKLTEAQFSVLKASKGLRKISPALISLILKKKRRITLDRVEELCRLLNLNAAEKFYFRNWIASSETSSEASPELKSEAKRKNAGLGLLSDWLNIYVKDYFKLPKVQKNPDLLYKSLALVARPQRIEKCLRFLLAEGYLRRTLNGDIVVETNLTVADPKVSSKKIRSFHKGALQLAKIALDLFPPSERFANTMTIALSEKRYRELTLLIEEFSERLKEFAEKEEDVNEQPDQLYQLIINLSPAGGKSE